MGERVTPGDVVEMHARREAETRQEAFSALHARLLLADADLIDPRERIEGDVPQIADFENRDYKLFEDASRMDRNKFWRKKVRAGESSQFDDQYKTWADNFVEEMNALSDRQREEVFNPLFQQIGIDKREQKEFTQEDVKQLYSHYFSKDASAGSASNAAGAAQEKGVKQFVKDVLATQRGADGKPDMEKIHREMKSLEQFAVIFGEKASEVVSELLIAEAELQSKTHKFDVARANDIDEDERGKLLQMKKWEREANLEGLITFGYRTEIQSWIDHHDTMLLIGGTGCGKTVGLPYMVRELMEEERQAGGDPGKFFITEPTIINTESLTKKIASDGGATLGEQVDYQHGQRQGSRYNPEADTVLMTQRTLINKLMSNKPKDRAEIEKLNYLMIDEAHLLSTDTVLLMALAKKEQERREKAGERQLKVFVASATIDEEKFREYLEVPDVVKIPGAMQEVHETFSESPLELDDMPVAAAERVKKIIESGEGGDIMIFVDGESNIKKVIDEVNQVMKEHDLNKDHSFLPPMGLRRESSDEIKEEATKKRTDGKRRIIVATDFAETGITIEGLKHVIDTGLTKEPIFDPQTGLQKVKPVKASQDACKQRRGRVGRVEPGYWYPLYTKDDFDGESDDGTGAERPIHIVPEITRTDLTDTLIYLKSNNMDIRDLKLLPEIDMKRVESTEASLIKLGILQKTEQRTELTELGQKIAKNQASKELRDIKDIHWHRMYAEAQLYQPQMIKQVSDMVALLKEGSLFLHERRHKEETGEDINPMELFNEHASDLIDKNSDFMTLYNTLQAFKSVDEKVRLQWAMDRGLDHRNLLSAERLAKKLIATSGKESEAGNESEGASLEDMIRRAYADRVFRYDGRGTYAWENEKEVNVMIRIGNRSFTNPEGDLPVFPHRIIAADMYIPPRNPSLAFLTQAHVLEQGEVEDNDEIEQNADEGDNGRQTFYNQEQREA